MLRGLSRVFCLQPTIWVIMRRLIRKIVNVATMVCSRLAGLLDELIVLCISLLACRRFLKETRQSSRLPDLRRMHMVVGSRLVVVVTLSAAAVRNLWLVKVAFVVERTCRRARTVCGSVRVTVLLGPSLMRDYMVGQYLRASVRPAV